MRVPARSHRQRLTEIRPARPLHGLADVLRDPLVCLVSGLLTTSSEMVLCLASVRMDVTEQYPASGQVNGLGEDKKGLGKGI